MSAVLYHVVHMGPSLEHQAMREDYTRDSHRVITLLTSRGKGHLSIGRNLYEGLQKVLPEVQYLWVDAICIYLDRHWRGHRGNWRIGPLISEGFRFALVGSGNIQSIATIKMSPSLGSRGRPHFTSTLHRFFYYTFSF